MKPKRRWLLLIIPLALFAWAYQAASWRPKLVGVQAFSSPPNARQTSTGEAMSAPQLLISPDGRAVAAVAVLAAQDELSLFALPARRPLWRYAPAGARIWPLAFSRHGRFLMVAVDVRNFGLRHVLVYLLDAANGRQLRPLWPGHYLNDLQSAAFLSNRALVISTRQSATVVDIGTGEAVRPWNFKLPELPASKDPWLDQSHVSADGTTILVLANGLDSTALALYDVKTRAPRKVWTVKGVLRNPHLSPDGKLAIMRKAKSGLGDVYDVNTNRKLWGPFVADNAALPWRWSADGQRLLAAFDTRMALVDARSGRNLWEWNGASHPPDVALAPDDNAFYTLDDQGKIWRWRLR